MQSNDLYKRLVDWSCKNSGHDFKRSYIGLSGIGDCELAIYNRMRNGRGIGMNEHLRTRLSYELEDALVHRLQGLGCFLPGETISLFDGLVQGHTDGTLNDGNGRRGDIVEIKTVPNLAALPEVRHLPYRVYWQVQAYLHYLKRRYAHVIYLARENGDIRVCGTIYDAKTGKKIEEKVGRLVDAVLTVTPPACTCGRCSGFTTESAEITEKSKQEIKIRAGS